MKPAPNMQELVEELTTAIASSRPGHATVWTHLGVQVTAMNRRAINAVWRSHLTLEFLDVAHLTHDRSQRPQATAQFRVPDSQGELQHGE